MNLKILAENLHHEKSNLNLQPFEDFKDDYEAATNEIVSKKDD